MDEEHFRIRLIHNGPSELSGHKGERHHHDFSSKVVTFFADAPERDKGDHSLQFTRLRTGYTDDTRIIVETPRFVLLTLGAEFANQWNLEFSVRYNIGEQPRPPCELAQFVVRSTVFLI